MATKAALNGDDARSDSAEDSKHAATLADAAVAMAEQQIARLDEGDCPDRSAPARRQLFVHLREERMTEDSSKWLAELHDGTPLSGETFKRLACDCGLVAARTDDKGNVLDIGRRRRTVSPALMRALLIRDRHCRFPGCSNHLAMSRKAKSQRRSVDAHHVEHWIDGGETSLSNTALLCTHHHHRVHEGGCSMLFDASHPESGGELLFLDEHGHIIEHVPLAPDTGDAPLDTDAAIHPRTNLPDWDGEPRDINGAVNALVAKVG